ncbi:MAG TPA: lipoprotein-releasing ABC transporter permease subunit [Alphaproteobacteria bacterium]|nr:lipoprotein-releasing ABC transporter permease subunit [Alphaproteobacteria bacterium]
MAFNTFERMMAMRYLRARRQEGFISVIAGFSLLGIALGVATLIIVMAVMNGFRAELLGRILGLNGHMTVFAQSGPLGDFDHVTQELRGVPGVVSATPLVEGQVMATSKGSAGGALVHGMRPEDLKALTLLSSRIVQGSLADFQGDDAAVIGLRMAQRFGISVGDRVTLISPQGNATVFGTMPRLRAYKVVALFNVGMYEYDSSFIYVPLAAAQSFFQLSPQQVTGIEIRVQDPDRVFEERLLIARTLGNGVRILDWQQANSSYFNAVMVERNVMFLILTLIIVVAAFNIISSMIMLVKDKSADIAILRTMGASRGAILRIFFLAGTSVGVIGTFTGFVLGLVFCANIETIRQWIQSLTGTQLFSPELYFLSQLPAKVDPAEVAQVVIMALALSILATIYPSWRAARLDPVEALRYE